MSERFENLNVWKFSHKSVLNIYKVTKDFPKEERYGITSQIRRSATSVPTNIAEGRTRIGENEFRQFLNIALGSCGETIYLLLLCKDLGYLKESEYQELRNEYEVISKMLFNFIQTLSKKGKSR
jgi:four helix bundle protein